MKLPVSERVSPETYQKLYQRGYRRGRQYERRQLAPVLEELEATANIREANNKKLQDNIVELINKHTDDLYAAETKMINAVVWAVGISLLLSGLFWNWAL